MRYSVRAVGFMLLRVAELAVVNARHMVAPAFQACGFFVKAGSRCSIDGAGKMRTGLFVTVLGAAQSRFIHRFMRGLGKRFQSHHINAGGNARFIRSAA